MRFCFQNVIFFLMVAFLSACQTTHAPSASHPSNQPHGAIQDSAPLGPIPTFFRAIIPKNERLSPYGNPVSYRVMGRTYKVMSTSNGYKERGVASWYASKFHSGRTSSGEPYDMYALTAAHKTLPLPTYLKVKNLQNGRQIIVKVNDRGPFHSGRVIDLSYGAAVKLGIFPKGTAPVELEAIPNNYQGQARVGRYYLQIGAFQSRASAEQLKTRLQRVSKSPVLIENRNRRYIVKVGPFNNEAASLQMKRVLSQHGYRGAFLALA